VYQPAIVPAALILSMKTFFALIGVAALLVFGSMVLFQWTFCLYVDKGWVLPVIPATESGPK
jgi:hypothetical protein